MENENILSLEQIQLTTLSEIVKNCPQNSFIMIEPESEYEGRADGILYDKLLLEKYLIECSNDYPIDPKSSLVLSAGVFKSRNKNSGEIREDLILNCSSVEAGWKLSLKLLNGYGSSAIAFFNGDTKNQNEPEEVSITSSIAELFLCITDILLSEAKKPSSGTYKVA